MEKIGLSFIIILMFVVQVSAQSILKDGKIPKDLVITISLTANMQFGGYHTYKIRSDGKVFFEEFSNLPLVNRNFTDLLLLPGQKLSKQPKAPKLKVKLSKKQLKHIILEFEKAGFFEIKEEDYCQPTFNHYTSKSLSITANKKTKAVQYILNCSYREDSPITNFQSLYNKIGEELKTVKKHPMKNQ